MKKKLQNFLTNPLFLKPFSLIGAKLITGICSTCRIEVFGKELEQELLKTRKDLLFPCWHRGIFYYAYHFRGCDGSTLISQSRDGEIIARIINHMGMIAMRGSTTRGGSVALEGLVDYIKAGHYGGFTPDGPIGPPYVSKIGTIMMAARTGSPLVPFAWDAYPSFEFDSWDKFSMPLPFSRIAALYDRDIIHVPEGLSEDAYEEIRRDFDLRMNVLNYQARFYVRNKLKGIDPRDIEVPPDFMDYLPKGKPRPRKNRPG
jgi:lysophospholipid acyltransferase (LPLAT)-like uncharacterized protein